jgi:uncharacterized membrane protein
MVNLDIYLNCRSHMLQVIWAIGASMLVLAPVQRLPVRWVIVYGCLVLDLHDLPDVFHAAQFGTAVGMWMVPVAWQAACDCRILVVAVNRCHSTRITVSWCVR